MAEIELNSSPSDELRCMPGKEWRGVLGCGPSSAVRTSRILVLASPRLDVTPAVKKGDFWSPNVGYCTTLSSETYKHANRRGGA